MRKPVPLPAPLGKKGFTIAEGKKAGLTRGRMANKQLIAMGRGLRIPAGVQLDLAARVRPYALVNESSWVSHFTAALLFRFPAPDGGFPTEDIHLMRPTGQAQVMRTGIVGHRAALHSGETTRFKEIPITSRARTWLDLAEYLEHQDLVVIADHLVRQPRPDFEGRYKPYCSLEELAGLLDRHPGKRGIRRARNALKLARVGSDSPPETRLRLALLEAGLPEPKLNWPLKDDDGKYWHSPDLSYPKYRLAIEYEGATHSQPQQVSRDIRRAEKVALANWEEIRISSTHMRDGAKEAVEKIRRKLVGKGWDGRP